MAVPAPLALLAAGAALVAGTLLAPLTPWGERDPAVDSAEAGFARDMQVHHAQAVAMATLAFDRSTDAEVRAVAVDIATTQQAEIGVMQAWLEDWGHTTRTAEVAPMSWMDGEHTGHAAGLMPGMATTEEMAALAAARGTAFDVLFGQLMHAHHNGGLPMAEQVLARTDDPAVAGLAERMRAAQRSELVLLSDIVERVSGGTATAATAHGHH